jgi:uncharacterized protein DUF2490
VTGDRHKKVPKAAWILVVLLGVAVNARAQQQQSDTRKEVWPEVDVYVPLDEKVRLFFLFTISKAEETKSNLEGQFGAHVDYTVNKRLVLRAGYRYGFSLTEDDPFTEHRPITEQTFRQPLPLKILLSDRNREDFRFVNGDFSFRYRNRVMLEREFQLPRRSITPYGSAEVYHDSRFRVWNRNRLTAGVQIQLKRALPLLSRVIPRKQIILDVYYTKQNDSRSQPHHIHALGTALAIHF